MLPTSYKIKDELDNLIEIIEGENIGYQVIATNKWHLPVTRQMVTYTLSSQRKMTIIEEFVINASLLNSSEVINVSSVSYLLGLDICFIEACVDELIKKNMLVKELLPNIKLSEMGEQYYLRGMVPGDSYTEKLEFYMDLKFRQVYSSLKQDDKYEIYIDYEIMNSLIKDSTKYLSIDFIIKLGDKQGRKIEHPEQGKSITSIDFLDTISTHKTLMTEVWVYDIVEDISFCKVWDHSLGRFKSNISDFIENFNSDNKLSVIKDKKLSHMAEDIKSIMKTKRDFSSKNDEKVENGFIIDTYKFLELDNILDKLNKRIKTQIIILTNYLDGNFISHRFDSKLKDLAKKNIQILIGIDSTEFTKKSESVQIKIDELLTYKNNYGIPVVCIVKINYIENMAILIDEKTIITDLIEWVSYDGDYKPREKSIYYIENKGITTNQIIYWEAEFISSITTDIFFKDNYLELISDLNFILQHDNLYLFEDICKKLIQKCIENKQLNIIYNIAVFLIINNKYIYDSVRIINLLIDNSEYIDSAKKVLAYIKLNQDNDYKTLCEANDTQLTKIYGDNYDDINISEYEIGLINFIENSLQN